MAEFSCPEPSDDTHEDGFGKCHVCKETKHISCCSMCSHWFCAGCRWKLWPRGLGFVKELVGSRTPGCCGTVEMLGAAELVKGSHDVEG
jgi:hypothetical protein